MCFYFPWTIYSWTIIYIYLKQDMAKNAVRNSIIVNPDARNPIYLTKVRPRHIAHWLPSGRHRTVVVV